MMTTATLKQPNREPTGEPTRARALLSTADFQLIRAALSTHAKTVGDEQELGRIAALHHRLGSYT